MNPISFDLVSLVEVWLWPVALVFCRVGTAVSFLPAIGEAFVQQRVKLTVAIGISFLVAAVVQVPALPAGLFGSLALLLGEMLVGMFFGVIGRIVMGSLHFAGSIIGMQGSFSNAFSFDVSAAQQGSTLSVFLGISALALIFSLDLDNLMLSGLAASYRLMPPGELMPLGDAAAGIVQVLSKGTVVALEISSPFIVASLVSLVSMGFISRVMPQFQILAMAFPVQIIVSLLLLTLIVAVILMRFAQFFDEIFGNLPGW